MAETATTEHETADARGSYKLQALRVLSEVTTSLAGEHDIEALLGRFLGTMMRLAGATAGAVRVAASGGAHLRLVAAVGLPPEVSERERLVDLDCGACGIAMREGEAREIRGLEPCFARTGLPYFRDCCSMVVVPLRYQGRILGTYNLFLATPGTIPEEVALLFGSIGEHLGMALENARLERENLRMTLTRERQLMANEVHDSLAQTLAYIKMRLAVAQESLAAGERDRTGKYLGDIRQALDTAYGDLRELLGQFRSRMDPLGLVPALERLPETFADRTGIALQFANEVPDLALTADQEVQVYHIVQEALANVTRHSGARRARLALRERGDEIEVTVEDDGLGFFAPGGPPDEHPQRARHLGIGIMRERAQRLGGRIETANLPQGGARVQLVFPRRAAPAAA
ncbi:MAG: histidine kinase [Burkholderiales bacterium]